MSVIKVNRSVRILGATGDVRRAMYRGVDHVVVPVTMLVEGVLWPVNAPSRELVLASEFSIAPAGWDGRPAVNDHPFINGQWVSANSPKVLELYQLGQLFETHVEGNELRTLAYLNPALVDHVKSDVLSRLEEKQQIEISVGTIVVTEASKGTHHGVEYDAIWRQITPDHLALLPADVKGACSIEMGCGTPKFSRHRLTPQGLEHEETAWDRVAGSPDQPRDPHGQWSGGGSVEHHGFKEGQYVRHQLVPEFGTVTGSEGDKVLVKWAGKSHSVPVSPRMIYKVKLPGFQEEVELTEVEQLDKEMGTPDTKSPRSLKERFRQLIGLAKPEEDASDLWQKVQSVLPDTNIAEVDETEHRIIYCRQQSDATMEQRSFTLSPDGNVILGDDVVSVEAQLSYVVKNAAGLTAAEAKPNHACGCQSPAKSTEGDTTMKTKDERIAALIASKKFSEADRKWLAEVPDEKLSAFEEPAPAEKKKEEEPAPAKKADEPKQAETPAKVVSMEEYIAQAPLELRDSLLAGHKAAQQHRAEVVAVIKASARNKFSDAQLAAKPVEELENIAALVATEQDFSGRGMPRAAANKDDVYRNLPDPYEADLEKMRAARR